MRDLLPNADAEVVKRTKLHKFKVLPKGWIVECSMDGLRRAATSGRTVKNIENTHQKVVLASLSSSKGSKGIDTMLAAFRQFKTVRLPRAFQHQAWKPLPVVRYSHGLWINLSSELSALHRVAKELTAYQWIGLRHGLFKRNPFS